VEESCEGWLRRSRRIGSPAKHRLHGPMWFPRAFSSSTRSRTRVLSPATSKSDLRGSSAARISSSAAREVALKKLEQRSVLWFSPTPPTL